MYKKVKTNDFFIISIKLKTGFACSRV